MQVIGSGTPRGPSFMQQLGLGVGQAIKGGAEAYQQHQQKKAIESLGDIYNNPDLSEQQRLVEVYKRIGSTHPELAKNLGAQLAGLGQKNIAAATSNAEDKQRYNIINKRWGPEVADLYSASTEGGKTALLSSLLEADQRGLSLQDYLNQQPQGQQPPGMEGRGQPTEVPGEDLQMGPETVPQKPIVKAIDYDKGLTPKERVQRQNARYDKNLPLYQASQQKMQGLESEKDSLSILEELSPQIGTLQRLNINPSTGQLIIPALASPEAQRYVKAFNDFTVKAKDSYGGRVTNFELDRFMQRLPSLANSEEARGQIIRQMRIINEINTVREKALQDVIEEHGGIRNIDYDRAEALADKIAKPQIEALRKEFKTIDNGLEKEYRQKIIDKKKKMVPPGRIAVEKDGKLFSIPSVKLKAAIKQGYKQI